MNTELWNKISQFDFDSPPGEYGFSTRLANENYWTKGFTQQSILEYKKFMYLAATSDLMVSPSQIVDIVWHQHLIFTQSYQDFCNIISKQVQHNPSTHNKEEFEKFKQAKERTKKFYLNNFEEQPNNIWEYAGMFESLNLAKASLKIRAFIICGILGVILLIVPSYYLLNPIYLTIDNPYFIPCFITLTILTFIGLETFNCKQLRKIINQFDKNSFIYCLQPLELVYLKTEKLSNVINGLVNELVENGAIIVNANHTLEMSANGTVNSIEQLQIMNVLNGLGKTYYPAFLRQLSTKTIFRNTAKTMDAFKKYFNKSKKFGALFYVNFGILAVLLILASIRFATGILRDKPITQILLVVIVLTILIVIYLNRLTKLVCSNILPEVYKKEILTNRPTEENWQWSYFLSGTSVLAPSFAQVVENADKSNNDGYSSVSSCGNSCSSCGSSCSSCGGCGGGD